MFESSYSKSRRCFYFTILIVFCLQLSQSQTTVEATIQHGIKKTWSRKEPFLIRKLITEDVVAAEALLKESTSGVRNNLSQLYNKASKVLSKPLSLQAARLSLLACSTLYGSNYVTTKVLQHSVTPSMITALRFLVASFFFVPSMLSYKVRTYYFIVTVIVYKYFKTCFKNVILNIF